MISLALESLSLKFLLSCSVALLQPLRILPSLPVSFCSKTISLGESTLVSKLVLSFLPQPTKAEATISALPI